MPRCASTFAASAPSRRATRVVGNQTRVKVVKNKVAPPFKQAEFEILYGEGISREGEMIDLGVEHGIVDKSGAWYSYGDDRIGQGKENVREFLKGNPEMADEIEAQDSRDVDADHRQPVEEAADDWEAASRDDRGASPV